MTIQDFELFHGAVLIKILRNDRPVTLLIETKDGEDRAYTIDNNQEKTLYIKHRLISNSLKISKKHPKGATTWQFIFSPEQINVLKNLKEKHQNKHKVFLALVCGHTDIKKRMEICIIDLDKYNELLDLNSSTQQSIGIRHIPGLSFRIMVDRKEKHTISLNLIDSF